VEWYVGQYGRGSGPPLAEFERDPARSGPNRWLDPSTLIASGVVVADIVERLAAARIDLGDPRMFAPAAGAIEYEWRGRRTPDPESPMVVLAHFDPAGVDPSFSELVRALVDAEREVVVCSTSIDERFAAALLADVVAVCRVPNSGLDWGSYQAGLRYVRERFNPGSVTFANDSVYVIPERLRPFLDRMDALAADLAGATDSDEFSPHVQSYLVRLGPRALDGALVEELLTTYVPISEKGLVIHAYELGFSRRAKAHGLELGAVHPIGPLREAALERSAATPSVLRRISDGIAVTPTLHLWRPLLENGFPFVKRQLIRDGMASHDELRPFVPERTLALAQEDIRRRGIPPRRVSRSGSGRAS
jgi:hypothetical protein